MRISRILLGGFCLAVGALAFKPHTVEATCSPNAYISTVCWTGANFCPEKHAVANGTILEKSAYPQLFALIGTTFGGDGISTFALPDLRGRSTAGAGTGEGLLPVPLGQRYGHEGTALTVDNLPTHVHEVDGMTFTYQASIKAFDGVGDEASPEDAYPAGRLASGPPTGRRRIYSNFINPNADMAADIVVATYSPTEMETEQGSLPGKPEEIYVRPPQLALLPCVAMEGIYPDPG